MEKKELKKLFPKKLLPPPEVILKTRQRKSKEIPKNRVLRFFWIFFGEGF